MPRIFIGNNSQGAMREVPHLKILLTLVTLFILLSVAHITPVDKSTFNTATFILEKLPLHYYLGLMLLIAAMIVALLGRFCKPSFIAFLIIMFTLYLEAPRFSYPYGFQMEYFHQAQVFHVINYGTFTDRYYPFPRSDVSHAIFSAMLIAITGLDALFVVGHVIPILLRVLLTLMALVMVLRYMRSHTRRPLTLAIPVYVLVCDTEPSFTNHYIYALPIYIMIVFTLLEPQSTRKFREVILLALASLSLTHIYFATLTMISLVGFLIYKLFTRINGDFAFLALSSFIFFLLWHGYISEWSIRTFHKELMCVLNKAYQRLLALRLNPAGYVVRAYERFGSISVRADYEALLWTKWLTVALFNALLITTIIILVLTLTVRHGIKRALITLLDNPILWLWMFSATFMVIYGFTVTAHPQRVLEAFIIPGAGVLIYLLTISKKYRASKVRTLAYALTVLLMFSIISIPTKILFHWGTSLTYIGFTEQYIAEILFVVEGGKRAPMCKPIYFVGINPYWLLNEILSKMNVRTVSLGVPMLNTTMWIQDTRVSVATPDECLLLVDFTSGYLPLNAKYNIRPLIDTVATRLLQILARESNVIYMSSMYTYMVHT